MKFPFSFWGVPSGRVIAKRSVATDPHAAIKVATASTVDWGDGTPLEAATANVQLNHVYTALGEMTVTITADAPHPINPDLSLKHPASTATDAGWKEVTIRDPHMTTFTVKPTATLRTLHVLGLNQWKVPDTFNNFNRTPGIEEIVIDSFLPTSNPLALCVGNTNLKRFTCLQPATKSIPYAFQDCKSLESILWDVSQSPSVGSMFQGANLLFNPVFDLPETTTIDSMFRNATGMTSITVTGTRKATRGDFFLGAGSSPVVTVNRMDLDSMTKGDSMFRSAHMVNHPGYIGELTQDVSAMFYGCSLLETIGDIGMANVTNANQLFFGCPKLRSFTLRGLKVSVSVNAMSLDATALDAVFTSLGTANAGATINITGNPGAATCNKAIATAKNWAVTG